MNLSATDSNGSRPRRCRPAFVALLLLGTALAACVTDKSATLGIQPEFVGFVPARTAILPCRLWPAATRYAAQPLTSLNDAGVKALCDQVDAYVVQSFDNQPYMKAFSPKFTLKALETAGVEAPDVATPKLWARQPEGCGGCVTAPAAYSADLQPRVAWQAWLSSLSTAVRNADAVLMPFLIYADERRYDDRGLAVVERRAEVALLLIDTASAALIWSGAREATVPAKRLVRGQTPGVPADLAPLPWDAVTERILTEDLWRDYPGRQVF